MQRLSTLRKYGHDFGTGGTSLLLLYFSFFRTRTYAVHYNTLHDRIYAVLFSTPFGRKCSLIAH